MSRKSKDKIRAVALHSGGLDSSLAVKIVAGQGIELTGVNCCTGFCHTDLQRRLAGFGLSKPADTTPLTGPQGVIPVEILDLSAEYLDILTNPSHGYGSAINPCVDCRILMLKKAGQYMESLGADFLVTGEVLGQRPMTQMLPTLKLIEKESGCEGLILRPLSARLLEPSLPEREGWVDREKLFAIKGRSRKPQMALAAQYGLTDYPQPAGGGCILTDKNYARRLRDFLEHLGRDRLDNTQALVLSVGRHFRISPDVKVIVGRFHAENVFLGSHARDCIVLDFTDVPGPIALVVGRPGEEELALAARLAARYSDGKGRDSVEVTAASPDGSRRVLPVSPLDPFSCEKLRI